MLELKNEYINIVFNDDGAIESLLNLKSGRLIAKSHCLFRLILNDGVCLEFETLPSGPPLIKLIGDNALSLDFESVHAASGKTYKIQTKFTVILQDDEISWGVFIRNNEENLIVREIHYPVISIADPRPPMAAITSEMVSTRIADLPALMKASFTDYMAPDQKYIRRNAVYPGRSCSMNFFELDWGSDGFYYACHDRDFEMTMHCFEQEKDSINMFMSRFPFLKSGASWQESVISLAAFSGDWTTGASKYREWADSWLKIPDIPEKIRYMSGWQRLILKHQYGEYFFRYDDLERAVKEGLKSGIDSVFLFGWTSEGMDAGYPVYSPDESQGGFEALKRNVRKIQALGVKVILYYNGQLIDAASEFYRKGGGQAASIKRSDGTEHREFYNFSNTGTFLREFGNKTFAVACPSSREWIEILKKHIDFAAELGADSVFFDQIGLASYPCCNESHGHPVPYTGLMNGKVAMLKELYEHTKSLRADMGLGIECTTDIFIPYCDFFHIFGNVSQSWNEGWSSKAALPLQKSGSYIFKAAFPETVISNRNIRDDSDVEFPVNRTILLGSRSDVEIYRCRADISATPHYQQYLGKANAFRERNREILYGGDFSASKYHRLSNSELQSNSFRLGNKLAVIITQSHKASLRTEVFVPGYKFLKSDSISGDLISCADSFEVPRHCLALLLYEKKA